jgi:hypothetical protein
MLASEFSPVLSSLGPDGPKSGQVAPAPPHVGQPTVAFSEESNWGAGNFSGDGSRVHERVRVIVDGLKVVDSALASGRVDDKAHATIAISCPWRAQSW